MNSFGEFVRALRVIDQTSSMRLDVHFISDMQQSAMPPSFADLRVGPHTALTLHCIDKQRAELGRRNCERTRDLRPIPRTRDRHRRWLGNTGCLAQSFSRFERKSGGFKEVNLPPDGHAQVEFLSFDVPYGTHRGEVRIEPHDGLPRDDRFPFSLQRSDPRNILFLYERGRTREAFYYRAAIESASDTGLKVRSAPIEQASEEDFSKYAFVVLGDVGELDQILERRLREYVQKGGSVLISLGPNMQRAGRVQLTGDRITRTDQTQGAGFLDNQVPR